MISDETIQESDKKRVRETREDKSVRGNVQRVEATKEVDLENIEYDDLVDSIDGAIDELSSGDVLYQSGTRKPSTAVNLPSQVAIEALKAMKETIASKVKDTKQILQSGVDNIINSEWYKNLTDAQKIRLEKDGIAKVLLGYNKLKSTIHQVVNPPRELWGTYRYSIPFFMHPVSDMKLNCLPECIDENNPKLYEDITAGDYLYERLVDLGLIKK